MLELKPSQIVALDLQDKSLYCEVIDTIEQRFLCWVRPIILIDKLAQETNYLTEKKDDIYDVRFTSDLLWDLSAFRLVLDTEYIQYLVSLDDFVFDDRTLHMAKQKLRSFIRDICHSKPKS